MKRIFIASFGLNMILVGTVAYLVSQPKPPSQQPAAPDSEAQTRPAQMERARPVMTGTMKEAFHWRDVESSDFRQYMENLRAIGCPEETIRDLIVAEVNKMFSPRFAALAAETQKFEHWRNSSLRGTNTILVQLRALHEERRGLLRQLLGIDDDPYAKWANIDLNGLRWEGKFNFIAPEKQAQVRAILEKYEQRIEAARAGRGELAGDGNSTKRLREQRQQELAQILSPDELKELALRDSNAADSLRSRFGAMDLTEGEYRKLYELRKAYEDAQGVVADFSDPEKVRQRSEARRQLEDAYRAVFGEDRWNELQKQQDPTWRGLSQVGQQNNLSPALLDQAWQYQRQTGEQISRLIEDRSLAGANREAAIQQMITEYERTLQGLLGDQAYQQFKQTTPQFRFSSGGGDTFTFAAPIAGPGTGMRSITVSGNGGQTDVRTQVRIP